MSKHDEEERLKTIFHFLFLIKDIFCQFELHFHQKKPGLKYIIWIHDVAIRRGLENPLMSSFHTEEGGLNNYVTAFLSISGTKSKIKVLKDH